MLRSEGHGPKQIPVCMMRLDWDIGSRLWRIKVPGKDQASTWPLVPTDSSRSLELLVQTSQGAQGPQS